MGTNDSTKRNIALVAATALSTLVVLQFAGALDRLDQMLLLVLMTSANALAGFFNALLFIRCTERPPYVWYAPAPPWVAPPAGGAGKYGARTLPSRPSYPAHPPQGSQSRQWQSGDGSARRVMIIGDDD